MIKTIGIYHMGIPCNDVRRAVTFYTEVLGMTIAKLNHDDMGKDSIARICGVAMAWWYCFNGLNRSKAILSKEKERRTRPLA